MRARVVWSGGGMRFKGRAEAKPWVAIQIPDDSETPEGSTPMELMFLSALACTATDVVSILRKGRSKPEALTVEGEADRAKTYPRIFRRVHLVYRIRGAVKEAAARRAVNLSNEKYCSAMITLKRAGARITSEITLEPARA